MWEDTGDNEPLEWANDKEARKNFVGKVFMLTGAMLTLAAVVIILPMVSDDIQEAFAFNAIAIGITALVLSTVSLLTLTCCRRARHIFPLNLILIIILCLSYGLIGASTASRYDAPVVLVAFGTTVVIVLLVGIIAKWGPVDITGCSGFLMVLSVGLTVVLTVGLVLGIFYFIPVVHLIISCISVIVFVLFLMFDMQMILGGRREQLDSEEHILGAVLLFIDIMIIFMYLLDIIKAMSR